jgi:xanthine dehydrogenase YagT iron-sulfur-binding subunit
MAHGEARPDYDVDPLLGVNRRHVLAGGAACALGAGAARADETLTATARGAGDTSVHLTIDGVDTTLSVDSRTTLLDALREHAHPTGTK